jgi:hypothetical protein
MKTDAGELTLNPPIPAPTTVILQFAIAAFSEMTLREMASIQFLSETQVSPRLISYIYV